MLRYDSFLGGGGGAAPAGDPHWDDVVWLMGFEGADGSTAIVDESQDARTVTVAGNAQIDTAQFKFGPSSLLLDGGGDFVSIAHAAELSVGAGDFTMECFIRPNELGRIQTLLNKRDTSSAEEFSLYFMDTNLINFQMYAGGSVINLTGSTALTTGQWYHVAASRAGSTVRIFLDGVKEGEGTQSGAPSTNTSQVRAGRDGFNTARDFNGWMDEVRYTKGTARYTADFTPPTSAFPRG